LPFPFLARVFEPFVCFPRCSRTAAISSHTRVVRTSLDIRFPPYPFLCTPHPTTCCNPNPHCILQKGFEGVSVLRHLVAHMSQLPASPCKKDLPHENVSVVSDLQVTFYFSSRLDALRSIFFCFRPSSPSTSKTDRTFCPSPFILHAILLLSSQPCMIPHPRDSDCRLGRFPLGRRTFFPESLSVSALCLTYAVLCSDS